MFKFSSLVAAVALLCATGVQAAPAHEASTSGATLALASVAGSACQTAGACNTDVSMTSGSGDAASEPNNYVLMAAGLGVVGLIASRRRSKI